MIDPTGEAYDLPDRFTVDSTSLILAGRRIDIWESPCGRPMLVDDALEIETLDKHIPVRIIYS